MAATERTATLIFLFQGGISLLVVRAFRESLGSFAIVFGGGISFSDPDHFPVLQEPDVMVHERPDLRLDFLEGQR